MEYPDGRIPMNRLGHGEMGIIDTRVEDPKGCWDNYNGLVVMGTYDGDAEPPRYTAINGYASWTSSCELPVRKISPKAGILLGPEEPDRGHIGHYRKAYILPES